MVNGVSSIGVNNQNNQMTFRAKGDKAVCKLVDAINETAVDFLHKDRPIEEKRETMIRRYVTRFTEVFGTKSQKNKLVETANKASKEANLEALKRTAPEEYKEVVKNQKEQEAVMEAYNKAYEKFVLKRMMKEDPEKAKVIMRNRIIAATNEQILKMLSPKNLIKMYCDYLTTQTAVGLGKVLGKCDKAFKNIKGKIPFIEEAKNRKFAKYEQYINKAVDDRVMDAEQAGELLIKADPKISKK